MLLLGIRDPIIPSNTLRIGIEFLGNLLDIFWFPTSNLDKRARPHFIEGLCEGRPDPIDLFEIVFLRVLTDLELCCMETRLSSILAGLARHCGCGRRSCFGAKCRPHFFEAFLQTIDMLVFPWNTLHLF